MTRIWQLPENRAWLVKTVLFVCTANICRSPMAAGLLRHRLAAMGLAGQVRVESAGVHARDGWPASEYAIIVLAERGIQLGNHRSRSVTTELLKTADAVLVMEEYHRHSIFYLAPEHLHKVLLLSELVGTHDDIPDPYGGPIEGYVTTAAHLDALIKAGLPHLLELIGVTPKSHVKHEASDRSA